MRVTSSQRHYTGMLKKINVVRSDTLPMQLNSSLLTIVLPAAQNAIVFESNGFKPFKNFFKTIYFVVKLGQKVLPVLCEFSEKN